MEITKMLIKDSVERWINEALPTLSEQDKMEVEIDLMFLLDGICPQTYKKFIDYKNFEDYFNDIKNTKTIKGHYDVSSNK